MEFKGTKGKWSIFETAVGYRIDSQTQSRTVCSNVPDLKTEEDTANALLISKAPEMLEILQKVSVMCEHLKIAHVKNEIDKLIKQATEI